jgi:NADH-quinone oxidoreductase subunit L
MGGLREYLPVTYKTFLVGAIAIAGIPPLAGFFSKDEILWMAFSSEQGSLILWLLGLLGAAMTAFYMFRLVILTFEGEKRFDDHDLHPHEAPKTMTVPLIILAMLSAIGGFVGFPHASALKRWLDPVFSPARYKALTGEHAGGFTEYLLMFISVAVAAACIWAAWWVYVRRTEIVVSFVKRYPRIYRMVLNKYYIDEMYDAVIVGSTVKVSHGILWKVVDVTLIDGTIHGLAWAIGGMAKALRKIQTGVAQSYAMVFIGGVLFVIAWLLLK